MSEADDLTAFREAVDDPHAWRRLNLPEIVALADLETPWRCHGIAADGYLTVLAGRGGEGKSILTLGLAGAVIHGSSLAGIECKPGRVAIFDAENGPKLIGRRLKAAGTPHNGLAVYDAGGLDLAAGYDWIKRQLADVDLAVFDSLRTLAAGAKENDSDDMAPRMIAIRQLARDTSTAIILVHHRGRESERDYRGSSVIRDQTDLMIVLERDDKDPEGNWRRCLRTVKCRIDEEPAPRWLGIRHNGGELYFTQATPPGDKHPTPRRSELAAQVLTILTRDGHATRGDVARKLNRERNDGTIRRVFIELHGDGRIAPIGDLWHVANPEMATPPLATPPNPNNHRQTDVANPEMATHGNGNVAKLPPPRRGGNSGNTATPHEDDQL